MKKLFTLKIILCFLIIVTLFRDVLSQSTIEYQTGTTIEVTTGADICADNITINGTYTGDGTKCSGPLPVELVSFSALVNGGSVNLAWETSTEVNNYGFEVERKTFPQLPPSKGGDHQIGDGWKKVGFVQGNGNSNLPKKYSFTDNKLIGGSKFSYRLKQIDSDGQYDYSNVVEVCYMPDKFELSQNFPNPFNPNTIINYQLLISCEVSLKIYDVLSNEVATLVNEEKPAGSYSLNFNAAGLSSGIYLYRLQAGNFVQTRKMTLIK